MLVAYFTKFKFLLKTVYRKNKLVFSLKKNVMFKNSKTSI